ncbi:MAG: hypothetical protein ACYCZL_12855 [Polaromonas sp.]
MNADSADMLASTLVDAQVFFRLGVEQPEYVPDFVMETAQALLTPHDLVTDDKRLVDFVV